MARNTESFAGDIAGQGQGAAVLGAVALLALVGGGIALAVAARPVGAAPKPKPQPGCPPDDVCAVGDPSLSLGLAGGPFRGREGPRSHWTAQQLAVPAGYGLSATARWRVINNSQVATPVYLDMALVIPGFQRLFAGTRLIQTFPGNLYRTDVSPLSVRSVICPSVTVPAYGAADVSAAVVILSASLPEGMVLDVYVKTRRVQSSSGLTADDVGPVLPNGEHSQLDVVTIVAPSLLPESLPDLGVSVVPARAAWERHLA